MGQDDFGIMQADFHFQFWIIAFYQWSSLEAIQKWEKHWNVNLKISLKICESVACTDEYFLYAIKVQLR